MYTKHTWQSEELITADKLNNLEEGVSSVIPTTTGYLSDGDIFTVTSSEGSVKKMVWREIEVPLTIVEEGQDSLEEVPNIDSSVDTETFYKILNLEYKEATMRFTGTNTSDPPETAETADMYFPCVVEQIRNGLIIDGELLDFFMVLFKFDSISSTANIIPAHNKAWVDKPNFSSVPTVTFSVSLLAHGFLPAEE